MAIDANSTTALAALLSASISSVCFALERTHTLLHGGARPDTLAMLYLTEPGASRHSPHGVAPLPPLGVAISRRREVLGSYDGGRANG